MDLMLKNIIVTFEYDTETETVANVQCSVDGIEKKKRTTTKKKSETADEVATEPLITREETKLVFNSKAVEIMQIEYEDRIAVKWEPDKVNKRLFPVIGKASSFDENQSGNKVTKSNTIAYKGNQNTILKEVGDIFTIEEYMPGIWKLLSTTSPTETYKTLENVIKKVEKVNPDLITDTDESTNIDQLQFTLN